MSSEITHTCLKINLIYSFDQNLQNYQPETSLGDVNHDDRDIIINSFPTDLGLMRDPVHKAAPMMVACSVNVVTQAWSTEK